MEGKRFLETIRLHRVLSYGPSNEDIVLEPLNVLIGPNASGKSNLIEALSVLQAAPRDIQAPTREGGGVGEWLWKREPDSVGSLIDVTLSHHSAIKKHRCQIRYSLTFAAPDERFHLLEEEIQTLEPKSSEDSESRILYKGGMLHSEPLIYAVNPGGTNGRLLELKLGDVRIDQSILSQRRDPQSYPELTHVALEFERIRFYREWNFGRHASARHPQRTDDEKDFLLEDASNLALVLNNMMNQPGLKGQLLEHMTNFYPFIDDINTTINGGTVQIFFHEKGLQKAIPATRLSDGSLQYLCLLAVLLHPVPPNVICIEEPELGLHPDIIPEVGKLLIEASKRSQIFVTTHSDILVDSLSEVPEAVVVCEKVDGATQLRRLDSESLKHWLKDYGLGQLWTRGELGGTRW